MHDDFGVGVTDNGFTVFAALVFIELRNILRHGERRTAVSTNRTENLNDILCRHLVRVRANQFPTLIDKDGLTLCAVFLDFRPDKVQNDKHRHRKGRTFHAVEVEYNVFGFQVHIRRTGYSTPSKPRIRGLRILQIR